LGPGSIRMFGEHRGSLKGSSPKHIDLVHSSQFSMLLLIDFGPGAIRTFRDHRGSLTGTSAKIINLVHFGQFSILLLTDFGSRVDPDVWGTPGFAYEDLAKTRRFRPF
jgi:hypothetical protein